MSHLLPYADIKFDMTISLGKTRSKSKGDEVGFVMELDLKYRIISEELFFCSAKKTIV